MKTKWYTISAIALLLVAILILSGCGTLEVDVEPVAGVTATATAPSVEQPAAAPTASDEPAEEEVPQMVWDALMATSDYLAATYGQSFPAVDSGWTIENITPEGLVGNTTFRLSNGDYLITVSYPIVAPDATIFHVVAEETAAGFRWEGSVDAQGQITDAAGTGEAIMAVAWYGYVVSTPEGAQFDDYLVLWPESLPAVGLSGSTAEIEDQIVALRDIEMPGKYAHFWGRLMCDVPDYGGCQLVVERLLQDGLGTTSAPEVVDGWVGTLFSVSRAEPGSGYDDYFVLDGDWPVQYGIGSPDETVQAQLDQLRDSGTLFRIWGELTAGVPDAGGTNLMVTRLEAVGDAQPIQNGVDDGGPGQAISIDDTAADSLGCRTSVQERTSEWVACNVIDGLISRNTQPLPGFMGDPFIIGYWGSEGVSLAPEEAVATIQDTMLAADPSAYPLAFVTDQSQFPPLQGMPVEGMFGPDVALAHIVYSEGWGEDGQGAALIFIAQEPSGGFYWHGMIYSAVHFDK